MVICKLEMVHNAPFESLGAALAFFNSANPARYKSLCLQEPETKSKPRYPDFHELHPDRVWASIATSIAAALKWHSKEKALAWQMRNIGDRMKHTAAEDLAKVFNVNVKTIYRWLGEINRDVESELERKNLLPID